MVPDKLPETAMSFHREFKSTPTTLFFMKNQQIRQALTCNGIALFLFLLAVPSCTAASFVSTGSLNAARELHAMTTMSDGKMLVVGGYGTGGALYSAELFDPSGGGGTGTWSTTGSMHNSRYGHTATTLANGKVLVKGGGVAPDTRAAFFLARNYLTRRPGLGRRQLQWALRVTTIQPPY
jgi:hypothetical protein